jgi:putative flavoprotein involved in K+ transport
LTLFTKARFCSLPGMSFPGPGRRCSTKDEVADYLQVYAEHFDLPVRLGMAVDGLTHRGDGYELRCGRERLWTRSVVLATGAYQRSVVPAAARLLDPPASR